MKNQMGAVKGFSLVELMVAMTIGLILTLGIATLFVDSMQTQTVVNEASRVQEAGRIILKRIQDDVRKAGYRGCNIAEAVGTSVTSLRALNDGIIIPGEADFLPNAGVDAASTSFSVSYLRPFPDANSFGVTMDDTGRTVTLSAADQVLPAITQGTQIVISNCLTQEIINTPAISAGSTSFTLSNAVIGDYRGESNLYTLTSRTYYVADSGRGNRSLFMQTLSLNPSNAEELVENVAAGGFTLVNQNTTVDSYLISLQVAGSADDDAVSRAFSSVATRRNTAQ
ncbi:prepilin-type N-terminal cleavage/methylation domain-containing protein [Parendozoicomonas sp. Alg238-R29]|uniref:PilW family protein n=1 Tax=Parendozoicomonas sp. Alg238-R29 TaxID=2993446 RepID=UPI00248F077E|nr:prepilin-type N-terminal cleavage/methylation domain-containing protein [Parendozoicomonas sp. Alg238-R29]